MISRWYIYKDGQQLGPFGSDEIRTLLRAGDIDPFDQVLREGSTVRRDLVEVDEIFQSSKLIYEGDAAATRGAELQVQAPFAQSGRTTASPSPALQGAADPSKASGFIPENAMTQGRSVVAEQQGLAQQAPAPQAPAQQAPAQQAPAQINRQLHLADPSIEHEESFDQGGGVQRYQAAQQRRRHPKKFHLLDTRGRVLGPVSAREVLTLFFRGVLKPNIVVLKQGSASRVPVARFVAALSQNQGKPAAALQGAHPVIQGGLHMPVSVRRRSAFGWRSWLTPGANLVWSSFVVLLLSLLICLASILAYKAKPAASRLSKRGEVSEEVKKAAIGEPGRVKPKRKSKASPRRQPLNAP